MTDRATNFAILATTVVCAVCLALAYSTKDELIFQAERGIGYTLGIAGLSMMTVLLGYPVSKRVPALRTSGWLPTIFAIHMLLGILGPTAIILHSNFNLGSLNSSAAFLSMLLVSGSGYFGRFLFVQIRHGLLSSRETLGFWRERARSERGPVAIVAERDPEFARTLSILESRLEITPETSFEALRLFFSSGRQSRRVMRRGKRLLAAQTSTRHVKALRSYLRSMRRVFRFGAYERAFALWHALHIPFCFLLFGAAAVHVVAVHLY